MPNIASKMYLLNICKWPFGSSSKLQCLSERDPRPNWTSGAKKDSIFKQYNGLFVHNYPHAIGLQMNIISKLMDEGEDI